MFYCKKCNAQVGAGMAKCPGCGNDIVESYEVDCISCGALNKGGNRFCSSCGALLPMIKKPICVICGTMNVPGAKFCCNCGGPILMTEDTHTEEDIIEQRKQKMRADLIEKERLTSVEQEVSRRRQKITQEELNSRDSIIKREKEFDEYIHEKARKLERYKKLLEEIDSPDIIKLKKLSKGIRSYSQFLANPYGELYEEDKENALYICPVCGAENALEVTECRACGRNKERTEKLKSKSKIVKMKNFGKMNQIFVPAPFELNIEDVGRPSIDDLKDNAKTISDILSNDRSSRQSVAAVTNNNAVERTDAQGTVISNKVAPSFQGMQQGEPYQMPPIIQPVAFVPYVTQDQPLLQYTADEGEAVKKR